MAKTGKISKATEVLNVSQPAISQHIKTLEEQAGFKLFTRSKKGVKLTNEAQEIYSYCKSIFAQVKSINHTLEDLTKYRTLLLEKSSHSRKFLDANLLKYNIELHPKFELASLDLLIEFAKKKYGHNLRFKTIHKKRIRKSRTKNY